MHDQPELTEVYRAIAVNLVNTQKTTAEILATQQGGADASAKMTRLFSFVHDQLVEEMEALLRRNLTAEDARMVHACQTHSGAAVWARMNTGGAFQTDMTAILQGIMVQHAARFAL